MGHHGREIESLRVDRRAQVLSLPTFPITALAQAILVLPLCRADGRQQPCEQLGEQDQLKPAPLSLVHRCSHWSCNSRLADCSWACEFSAFS
eukprot:3270506-Amphidinium_carterae.1